MGSKGEAPRLGPLAKGAQYVRYLQGDKQVPPQVPQHRGLGVPSVPRLRQVMDKATHQAFQEIQLAIRYANKDSRQEIRHALKTALMDAEAAIEEDKGE